MPFYDLACAECKNEFNVMASMTDRTNKKIACPKCGSNNLDAVFKSVFFNVKNDKAVSCPNSHVCGAGCSHARN